MCCQDARSMKRSLRRLARGVLSAVCVAWRRWCVFASGRRRGECLVWPSGVVSCGVWLGRARAGVAVSCMYVRSDCALRGLARRHTFQDLSIKIFTKYMDTSLMRHVCT